MESDLHTRVINYHGIKRKNNGKGLTDKIYKTPWNEKKTILMGSNISGQTAKNMTYPCFRSDAFVPLEASAMLPQGSQSGQNCSELRIRILE